MNYKKLIPKKIYDRLYRHFKDIIIEDLKSTKCTYELHVNDKSKLDNKVAIVTGGSGALGSAISFRLAMEGATVIVCGRNKEKLEFVCNAIKENNGLALQKSLDVTDKSQIEEVFEDVYKKYGHIDILVNNAGGGSRGEKKLLHQQSDYIINEIIDLVGISKSDLKKYPHEFSGGQRQRIAIARALILKPEFIVADEPVSALDVSICAQIINLLIELKEKLNLTILFISHDLNLVKYLSDRIAVMDKGKIVECGDVEEIFNNPKDSYTKFLLSSIRTINV